jgi:hypothetical protein
MSPQTERFFQNVKNGALAIAALTLAILAVVVTIILWRPMNAERPPSPPPDESSIKESDIPGLCGWAGEETAQDAFQELKGHFVPFVIWDTHNQAEAVPQDRRSVLWTASNKVLGKHLPTFRQEIGDCVSMGAANAVNYLTCVQMAAGENIKFRPAFQPWIYGTSRVLVGRNRLGCSSDGSVGAWAAAAVEQYGILFSDESGVPPYSGSVAKQWGCKKPAFEKFMPIADDFQVRSIAQVTTFEQVRDALVNGYPVTVASNQGFQMKGRADGGKLWGVPSGSWAHQMCFIGYDPEPRPCVYCINSWGENAHGKPVDDAPPGGFWVDAKTVARMVKQGDSFAYSSFVGFPENNEWDLNILLEGKRNADRIRDRDASLITALESRPTHYGIAP